LRHLDLFSGIGGFALAAQWAGIETVGFCEYNPKARRIIAKNFPGVPIHEDVRTLDPKQYEGIDIITGGYPCQPFSHAGKRQGEDDDRHLWPAMRSIIEGARPRWVIAENVAGHVTMGLDTVLSEMESIGYTCWPVVIPACAVDAPHRRDRVWIVGHANSARRSESNAPLARGSTEQSDSNGQPDSDAECEQCEGRCEIADTRDATIQGELGRMGGERAWCQWTPEPGVDRVAHGIPRRVDRLHGLGNAIVPQVAAELLRAIVSLENIGISSPPHDIAGRYPVNLRKRSGGSAWKRGGWEDVTYPFAFWNVKMSGCAVLTERTGSPIVCFGTRKHPGLRRISGRGGGEA
jgi:DNA (cytosine-5)-methyltransferase 1